MISECILEGGSIDFAWILNGFQYALIDFERNLNAYGMHVGLIFK